MQLTDLKDPFLPHDAGNVGSRQPRRHLLLPGQHPELCQPAGVAALERLILPVSGQEILRECRGLL